MCVGHTRKEAKVQHAQARADGKWIGISDGYLHLDVPQENEEIYYCLPVRQFDVNFKGR